MKSRIEFREAGMIPRWFYVAIFIILFLLAILILLPEDVFGQQTIFIQAPLNQIQVMSDSCIFESGTSVAIWAFSSADEEKGSGARDADLRAGRGQIARKWCESHGIKVVAEYHAQGKTGERGVRIIECPPSVNEKYLKEAFKIVINGFFRSDSILVEKIIQNRHDIGWLARQKVYGWEVSLGQEYVLIERNEFSAPTLSLTWNAGLVGFQGKIGGWSADHILNEKTYNGIWGGSFFVRPYKHLKFHAGYQGISQFFESDLTWVNRYDCFLTGVEIEIPEWKRLKGHLYLSGIKADKWGMSTGFNISLKL